ncbi:MAG TPA: hypothetical protein VIM11_20910 [Tepidisphaeraceae bacterium]|jgi:hypothetical protein
MQGKYRLWPRYVLAKAHRTLIHRRIKNLVKWQPLESPQAGYSIIIGCNTPLAEMLGANLKMLERQRLDHLEQILIVLDQPKDQIPIAIEQQLREAFPKLPLQFIYYTATQSNTARVVSQPWVYAWLSWCLGMAAARTRHCFLHDFDAMLINPEIIESRYAQIRDCQAEYCGVKYYLGNGLHPSDALAVTFELMFDLAFVRSRFHPIELANTVNMYKGRGVDFDTMLYAQSKDGRAVMSAVTDDDMVHPQQVICQFTSLTQRNILPPGNCNLLIVPYFLFLADKPEFLRSTRTELSRIATGDSPFGTGIPFFGRRLDLSQFTATHIDWIANQSFSLERAVNGFVRPEVTDFFAAIRDVVEDHAQPVEHELVPA